MTFALTPRQQEANRLLAGPEEQIMLFGGSRSGKTFLLCRAVAIRALKAADSRHLISRFRNVHVMASIWRDTWPKMMRLCFPDLAGKVKPLSSLGIQRFPNGSEVWFAGLDDDVRVEKILGNEFATIYLNECSQISAHSRDMLITRLAQNVGLKLKMYHDCNPPAKSHWTHRLFVEHREPEPPYKPLANPENYAAMQMNPKDNAANLPPSYLTMLQNLPVRQRLRFWDGMFGDAGENALWTHEAIERLRVKSYPDLQRIVVAVDPSGASGKEGERSDHIGVCVAGLGVDGHGYVLEDLTIKAGPAVWGRVACEAYRRHNADCIVGEVNYGGAMVEHVVQTAASALGIDISYREVTATRGKVVRAEPISALASDKQGRIHHVGNHPALEDELCAFTTAGYIGDRSPNRADAYVWAMTELFPGILRKDDEIDWNEGLPNPGAFQGRPGGWML